MQWMRRAVVILPALLITLAACAPAGSGAGDSTTSPGASSGAEASSASAVASQSAAASESADDEAAGEPSGRVDIDDILTDPTAFVDAGEVTVAENVDEVLVPEQAFLISGTMVEGDVLVVLTPDAEVDKEIEMDRVVDITGTVVALDDLEAAGAALGPDAAELADYAGEFVIVATAIGDPLAS